ncbi:restriction endonuclease subunit S [Xanthomonas arboricola]|uniref:restriction endonuclease subunit S n=1 Tax=Xanthomonas arboricola TaxID=56448 RepID=UPI0017CDD838|nr:restriction endonuclease subunit S [Xanthomonas arboricola]MBB6573134.1 type I restriction enzyme S subunit [Xanthomonas arboricola]
MIFKSLASIAKIVAGQSPESSTYNLNGEGLPFFQGKADFQDLHPAVRTWCTSDKRKEAELGDILISVRAPVGAVNMCNQKSIIGRGLAAIRPSSELDGKFLYYWLKTNERQIDALGTGSTFKAITQDTLKKIEVPLPSLDDQIRIAHLLGKVEGLIVQRKQHLQQLDDLLKSVFLKMFGDPVRNEKGWDKPGLKAFGKISTGNTPPRNQPENYDGDFIEWIKTDNITGDAVFVTPAAEHLSEIGVKKARMVTNGALLVACIAGSVESIGRASLTDRTVSFNQQINAIQPGKDVNAMYLYGLFKLSRAYIQSHATKGMKKILTKGDFEKITMIKPPVEIQNQFAVIVEQVEGVKSRYQQSLTDLEALYGALSQQAFKGELDLSRVTLPTALIEGESPVVVRPSPRR